MNPTAPSTRSVHRLDNPIMPYPWGSTTAIPKLLGRQSDPKAPQAEMWMGAHPKAPSSIVSEGHRTSLADWIASDPKAVLGTGVAKTYQGTLPFLFKVLAAAEPLSIQAHPDPEQARQGFAREQAQGIPVDAPNRNYRDPNHKPECLCALTPFWGLCGFRTTGEIARSFAAVFSGIDWIMSGLAAMDAQPQEEALRQLFGMLLSLTPRQRSQLLDRAGAHCRERRHEDTVCRWVARLLEAYPDDVGVLSPLMLNLICLSPGQALYLPAGEPHAYLEGVGMELMANSDNVLRGGLTGKHVDVPELLRVLRFRPRTPHVITGRAGHAGERVYDTPAEEFRLSVIALDGKSPYRCPERRSVEIGLCVDGKADLTELSDQRDLPLARGNSFIVPAACPGYRIQGEVTIYMASVPL